MRSFCALGPRMCNATTLLSNSAHIVTISSIFCIIIFAIAAKFSFFAAPPLFFSLTLGVFRIFPRMRNQRCRQLIHSSLIRINGRQKTIMAGMLNARLPDGGQLPISMATLTGVAITKEGKALADCQITCLCLCFSCWPLFLPLFSSLLVVQRV